MLRQLFFLAVFVSAAYAQALPSDPSLEMGAPAPSSSQSFIDYDASVAAVFRSQLDAAQASRLAELEMYLSRATDGKDYHFLVNACKDIDRLNVPGITLEIGTRLGGSSYLVMRETWNRTHVAVDPYGLISYRFNDGHEFAGRYLGYGNLMRNAALANLYTYAYFAMKNFVFYNLDDETFFARFAEGIPIYESGTKTLATQFALVFFDGPHSTKDLIFEIGFAAPRTPVGGRWILDNVESFRHEERIHPLVTSLGFKLVELSDQKASYIRETSFY